MRYLRFKGNESLSRAHGSTRLLTAVRAANGVCAAVIIVLLVILVRGLLARGGAFSFSPDRSDSTSVAILAEPDSVQSLSHYVSIVSGKRLFKKGAPREVSRSVERIHRITVQQLASSLVLVGIVGGNELVAVIRDDKTNKTYSLKAGEYINELLIDEITPHSVILLYESEAMELKL